MGVSAIMSFVFSLWLGLHRATQLWRCGSGLIGYCHWHNLYGLIRCLVKLLPDSRTQAWHISTSTVGGSSTHFRVGTRNALCKTFVRCTSSCYQKHKESNTRKSSVPWGLGIEVSSWHVMLLLWSLPGSIESLVLFEGIAGTVGVTGSLSVFACLRLCRLMLEASRRRHGDGYG